MRWINVFNLPNPFSRTRPWGSLSLLTEMSIKNRKKCFWGVERGWCTGLITLPLSVSRLSRQCGILNISQLYRPPQPVTGIALLSFRFFCILVSGLLFFITMFTAYFPVISFWQRLVSGIYIGVFLMTWVIQLLRLALSKGPNRAGISLLLSERGNRSRFETVVFASF
jgi:hypothetical protein